MKSRLVVSFLASCALAACVKSTDQLAADTPVPDQIIDLGTLITADTPKQFWGTRFLRDRNYYDPNSFNVIRWEYGPVAGSNAYYTLFNHGGPHVDAPSHVGLGGGLDAYPIDAFTGPLKVIDVSHLAIGRTVTIDMLESVSILPGDIVITYTEYRAPTDDNDLPEAIALNLEAAEYLASIPVRAFGTDAFNVESMTDQAPIISEDPIKRIIPGHHAFLSRGIPVYEQLVNIDKLVDLKNMYFVGVPLNIEMGDGMIVRPVVLVY